MGRDINGQWRSVGSVSRTSTPYSAVSYVAIEATLTLTLTTDAVLNIHD